MAITLLDNKSVVTFRGNRWWAEGGVVHFENVNTGQYGSLTINTALQRIRGLNDMIRRTLDVGGATVAKDADELTTLQRYIEDMIAICDKAKAQGDPENPNVVAQKLSDIEQRRNARIVKPTEITGM